MNGLLMLVSGDSSVYFTWTRWLHGDCCPGWYQRQAESFPMVTARWCILTNTRGRSMERIRWKWFGMTTVFSEAKYGLLSYVFALHLWLLLNMTVITHDGDWGLYAMCVRLLSWTSWARWTSWWSTPPPLSTSGPFSCRSTLEGAGGGTYSYSH